MKMPIALLAALLALTATTHEAFARSIKYNVMEAKLTEFNVDPALMGAEHTILGVIRYNMIEDKLHLLLRQKITCQPGMLCAAVMPFNYEVDLKVVSYNVDSCGIRTIVASEDHRPADGRLETLVLVDNARNTCPHLIALPATEVTYETSSYARMTGDSHGTRSIFRGETLHPVLGLQGL